MPMTHPDDVKGFYCAICGKWASHFDPITDTPVCCQCHGGEIWSEEDTRRWQEEGILPTEGEKDGR